MTNRYATPRTRSELAPKSVMRIASLAAVAATACSPFGLEPTPSDAGSPSGVEAGADRGADAGADAGEATLGDAGLPAFEVVQNIRSDKNLGRALDARFPKPLTDGNFIAVFAYSLGDYALAIADSDGNTYSALASARDPQAGSGRWFSCEHAKTTGKPNTIHLTVDASADFTGLVALELTFPPDAKAASSLLEGNVANIGRGASAVTSGEITTQSRQSLLLAAAWCSQTDSVPFSPGEGFTELARDDFFFYLIEYRLVTPGRYRTSATFPAGLTWGVSAASFRRFPGP